jgi:hypothetical protein
MNAYEPGVFAGDAGTDLGKRLWTFVNNPENIVRMNTATALERPAVEGIEEELLHDFADAVLDDRTKQMIGHMVRQVMERNGYVIAVQNVKMTSGAPFSRATRYKRKDEMTFHVFRSKTQPRERVLTADKAGTRLPHNPFDHDGKWVYWKSIRGALRVRIALGIENEGQARSNIAESGYHQFRTERLLRSA